MNSFYNVLVIGAGISGIGAGHYLKKNCPNKSFAIIENRDSIGGTWDLFKYPGIRSDSDMFTLGYAFKPWISEKAIADGPSILEYLNETVKENNLSFCPRKYQHYQQKQFHLYLTNLIFPLTINHCNNDFFHDQ